MATMITSDCINCGACEPECPNNAISQGDPVYVIDPLLCTECVGFHDYEACAAVCPVDVCVTDPNNIESEAVLIARARALHKETDFAENFQSRFRKAATPEKDGDAKSQPATENKSAAPAVVQAATPLAPKAVAAPVAATPVTQPAAKPEPAVKKAPAPKKTFSQELPASFEEVSHQYQSSGVFTGVGRKFLVFLAQPLLGALPHDSKKRLESAVQSPFVFSAAGSTALNIVHNTVIYPLVCMAIAIFAHGTAILFSQDINTYIFVGILLALAEGLYRLRDGILHAKPAEEMNFSASIYGGLLAIILAPALAKQGGVLREKPIPVDGFYAKGFVDKLERERRYGNVYTIEDRGGAYLLRLEFPRWIPDLGIASRSQLPDEMPDYDYDLALKNGEFIIKGKCMDEKVRKMSSSIGAFPPEFTTVIPLVEKVAGFSHHFENKILQVFLLKDKGSLWERSYN